MHHNTGIPTKTPSAAATSDSSISSRAETPPPYAASMEEPGRPEKAARPSQRHELPSPELEAVLLQARNFGDSADEDFRRNLYESSISFYTQAIDCCSCIGEPASSFGGAAAIVPTTPAETVLVRGILIELFTNRAMTYNLLRQFRRAEADCEQALLLFECHLPSESSSDSIYIYSIKARYLRARAREQLATECLFFANTGCDEIVGDAPMATTTSASFSAHSQTYIDGAKHDLHACLLLLINSGTLSQDVDDELFDEMRATVVEASRRLDRVTAASADLANTPNDPQIVMYPRNEQRDRCGACGARGVLKCCSQCRFTFYCNDECQRTAWEGHTKACSKKAALLPFSKSPTGLNNLGNTCYANAALQGLFHVTPLAQYFLTGRFRGDINDSNMSASEGQLALAFKEVVVALNRDDIDSYSPAQFMRTVHSLSNFKADRQHDAEEFLAYLLDGLHEDLKRIQAHQHVEMSESTKGDCVADTGAQAWDAHRQGNTSLLFDIFWGQFMNTYCCPKCSSASVSFDVFNRVSLAIPQQQSISVVAATAAGEKNTETFVTLDQCFDSFVEPECLDENNMWKCPHCMEDVQATKTIGFHRLPNVLIVHLKRFEFDYVLKQGTKLETLVDFPLEGLDLTENGHVTPHIEALADDRVPAVYDCFAVVNHTGSMDDGHFTAYARPWDETGVFDEWTSFDDSAATRMGDDTECIVSAAAYVMMYRRRTLA
jgi:ubiquitin C-terminal hydrolase